MMHACDFWELVFKEGLRNGLRTNQAADDADEAIARRNQRASAKFHGIDFTSAYTLKETE